MIVMALTHSLKGVDVRFLLWPLLLLLLIGFVSALYMVSLGRTYKVSRVFFIRSGAFRALALLASLAVFIVPAIQIDNKYGIVDFLFSDNSYHSYIEDNISLPDPDAALFSGPRNNLILIILESAESGVNDPARFKPILMPNLKKIQDDNVTFSDYYQTPGTAGNSYMGFYSLCLGMPYLLSRGAFNNADDAAAAQPSGQKRQEPGTQDNALGERDAASLSILGMLEKNGYSIEVFRCASIRFSSYLTQLNMTTVDARIFDYDYFRNTRDDYEGRTNSWGVNDSYIYERIREYLSNRDETAPFALLVQTVNTHSPGFYEPDMPRRWNDMRDSFVQVDILTAGFVEWVRNQEFGKNTTIVIIGDHLIGPEYVGGIGLAPMDTRSVYNVFINSQATPATQRKRLFAMWDFAPTILESVGATLPRRRFGLGTSLFADQATLLERDGKRRYGNMIKKRSRLYEHYYRW